MNNMQKGLILALVLLVGTGLGMILEKYNYEKDFIGKTVNINGTIYNQTLKNYYDVSYYSNGYKTTIEINNPCIDVVKSTGGSMMPYMADGETLSVMDSCFPNDDLKVGDIISYTAEWNAGFRPHHRIIDIDYEKKWVRTQGDNPDTNSEPDDFVSFDRIAGKDIGYLNVLNDKKIVREEIVNETNISFFFSENITFFSFSETCVCSSSGFLKFCHTDKETLEKDTFIQQNDLKEEYCDAKSEEQAP